MQPVSDRLRMASTTLVATKLFIPQVRPSRVARPRLLQLMNDGIKGKLTLICAPAGYGKTTLLSEWANLAQLKVAWISLDRSDNDGDRVLSYLVAALQSISPDAGMGELALAMRQSPQPLPLESVLAALINEMAEYEEPFAVILDDYHTVTSDKVQNLIASLIDYLPPHVHLVISSRTVPQLPLARYRARGELTELTADDLRFTLSESETFLSEVMALPISGQDIADLNSRTEGWVASLQFAALSIKKRENPAEAINQLTGAHRFILDYLAMEVLSDQPDEVQTFLLETSILESLTAALCNAVTSREDSQAILEYLEQENLFITSLDARRKWYRYHGLFRDFLLDRFNTFRSDHSDYHQRAAEWYQGQGLTSKAIDQFLQGESFEPAASLIARQIDHLFSRGEITTLASWIESLPEELIANNPRLALTREWTLLVRDPVVFWNSAVERIEHLAELIQADPHQLLHLLPESEVNSERRTILCEFAIMAAFVVRQQGDLERSITLYQGANEYLPSEALVMKTLSKAGLASVFTRLGHYRQAEQEFAEAAEISHQAGSIFFVVICMGFQASMQVLQGRLEKAKGTYLRAISQLTQNLGASVPLSGQVWAGLGEVFREQNQLDKALDYVSQGIARGERVLDYDALREGYITLARVQLALGDEESCRQAMRAAIRTAQETRSADCINEAHCWEARLEMMAGNLETARRWAQNRGLNQPIQDESFFEEFRHNELATYVRLLMTERRPEDGLLLLNRMADRLKETEHRQASIEIHALRALCWQAAGKRDEAVRDLSQAMMLGVDNKYLRIFIDEGPSMAALIRAAGSLGHTPDYAKRILEAFGEEVLEGAPLDPLSARELEVLALLAQGLTNKQIADELYIGVSTVKTHINRIYSKLGVSNRTQAFNAAQDAGLI